ncbi:MAG: hypothetical protein HC927_08725, partial [Deltaproteobacteria bacterium]|nr:hypothetical protein [Deltaproteobacteria bacterium]
MRPYVPLAVKSNFSFLEGASHPDELVEQAAHGALADPDPGGRRRELTHFRFSDFDRRLQCV